MNKHLKHHHILACGTGHCWLITHITKLYYSIVTHLHFIINARVFFLGPNFG